MTIRQTRTVGMMMPADMGGAVARQLAGQGIRVVTNLTGRSQRTRDLAKAAGVEDLGDDQAVAATCDAILSIVAPSGAVALAERFAPAIRAAGATPLYLDCNAIAPSTTKSVATVIEAAGGRFVDGGIIGPPPRTSPARTHFYISGPPASEAAELLSDAIELRVVSDRIGDASAVKMCYAALTKGSAALMGQLILASEKLGVREALEAEFAESQAEQLARVRKSVPASVPKAFRWVAEMQEIGRTFEDVGITGKSFEGAADMFAAIAETDLGHTNVEDWARNPQPFDDMVRRLAQDIRSMQADGSLRPPKQHD